MSNSFFHAPFLRKTVAACVASACAACSTLPAYKKPDVDVPQQYKNVTPASDWSLAAPTDKLSRGPWWTIFNDPKLNSLEAQIEVSNQSVKKAVSLVEEARAMVQYQHAGYMPTVSAGTATYRARLYSQNFVGHYSTAGKTYPNFLVDVSASWEPDLFGRVKDAVVNARDTAQATEADFESVRLSMMSDLAVDYFDLRALDIQKKLLDDAVKAYTDALNIVQEEFKNGAVDGSVVAAAQTQLESARTQDTDIDVYRAQLEHAIATLIGVPASSFSLAPNVTPVTVPDIPTGVPSQLLERRPDIAAAERRVAAANAEIGLAHAAYYPNLVLSPTAGLQSTYFSPWLTAGSLFWSLGAQLVGTIYDGGRRDALVKTATAQYNGTVADYRQTVLVAFQQVEDNLSSLHTLADEAQSQRLASQAAQLSLKLTTNRFQAGAVSYLDVVQAQTIALTNERNEDQIQARRVDAALLLVKALGGGWDRSSLSTEDTAKHPAPTTTTAAPENRG